MTESGRWIPVDPKVRAGMYTSIDQVPDHHRLRVNAKQFDGEDTWEKYLSRQSWMEEMASEKRREHLERTEQRWKSFMESRERHHALCTPADAEDYAEELVEKFGVSTETAAEYWGDIERFYRWMFHHAEYPHRYHPFVMAAATYDRSGELWTLMVMEE